MFESLLRPGLFYRSEGKKQIYRALNSVDFLRSENGSKLTLTKGIWESKSVSWRESQK